MARNILRTLPVLAALLVLAGCGGGSKILKEPVALDLEQPVAVGTDDKLEAALDWVIVKDGPGTWSKNAWWDEYLIRVANVSDEPVTISSIQVIDWLETPVTVGRDRKELVKLSKQTSKRYDDYDLEVKPGAGTGTMLAAGTGVLLIGSAAAAATVTATTASIFTAGAAASTPAIVGVVGTAAVVAAPVLIVGGIVKGANNSQVNKQIIARQVEFPYELAPGQTESISVFFPVSPSPRAVHFVYETASGPSILEVDTLEVLSGLHLENGPVDGVLVDDPNQSGEASAAAE